MNFFKTSFGSIRKHGQVEGIQIEPAEQQVDVRNCQWPARTITGRTGFCACALGAYKKESSYNAANGTATSCHGFNLQRRRHQVSSANLMGLTIIEIAIETGDIGAGPAHVEGYQLFQSSYLAHGSSTHDTRSRTARPCQRRRMAFQRAHLRHARPAAARRPAAAAPGGGRRRPAAALRRPAAAARRLRRPCAALRPPPVPARPPARPAGHLFFSPLPGLPFALASLLSPQVGYFGY